MVGALKSAFNLSTKVSTRIFLENCHKWQIGTPEIELTAKRMDGKNVDGIARNVKNVKRILKKRISDAVQEEHRARYEYVGNKIKLQKYAKKEKYKGREIMREFKRILKCEAEEAFAKNNAKHEVKFQRLTNKLKVCEKEKKYKDFPDELLAMELFDDQLADEIKRVNEKASNDPVVVGDITLKPEEIELLKTHPKMTDYKK